MFLFKQFIKSFKGEIILQIHEITNKHIFWDAAIEFAENCSWKAGKFLAKLMKENKFLSWERVFIACVEEKVIGYCTFAEKDELPEQYNFSPFIGFVFVDEKYRGNRISEQMINSVIAYAVKLGFEKVYIMSGERGLYERYGFEKVGDFETIYNTVDQLFVKTIGEVHK